jgi:hypothetical protein
VPALAARAPFGATYVSTGTGEAKIALMISRIEAARRVHAQNDETDRVRARCTQLTHDIVGDGRPDGPVNLQHKRAFGGCRLVAGKTSIAKAIAASREPAQQHHGSHLRVSGREYRRSLDCATVNMAAAR